MTGGKMQIKIKKNVKKDNEFKLEIVGTEGCMRAIRTGLLIWSGQATLEDGVFSPVAADVLAFLDRACEQNGIDLK